MIRIEDVHDLGHHIDLSHTSQIHQHHAGIESYERHKFYVQLPFAINQRTMFVLTFLSLIDWLVRPSA